MVGKLLSSVEQWFTRRPVTAGLVSGLLTGAILWVYSWLRDVHLLTASAPLVLLLLSLVTIVGLVVTLIIQRRGRQDLLFLLLPAYSKKEFFANLLDPLLVNFARHNYDVALRIPIREYDANEQSTFFDHILARRRSFKGGIVIPVAPHSDREGIRDFAKNFGRPILFLDTPPFENEEDYPENTAFLGVDSALGGRIAAEAIFKELEKVEIQSPRVLVIASKLQHDRHDHFRKQLLKLIPSATVRVDDSGRFQREEARRIARRSLRDVDDQGRFFHAIFCTNDEMALGVLDVLPEVPDYLERQKQLILCGYDGIEEVTTIIDRKDPVLTNTVLQDIDNLAERGVRMLRSMMQGASVRRITLLEPRIYIED